MVFLAEASSVALKGRSDGLSIFQHQRVGPIEAMDDNDTALPSVGIGQKMRWKAKMPGIPTGTPAKWTINCHQDKAHMAMIASGVSEVANGEVIVDWEASYPMDQANKEHQTDLDKTSETYQDAAFQAIFSCLGASARSEMVPVKTGITIRVLSRSKGKRTLVLPEGRKKEVEFTPENNLELDELPVGRSGLHSNEKEPELMGEKE
ncbi:MAG: hypothetical protein H6686_02925 [Fibrobacteria bacterium]|nr:hypothetical protein [Fibrobacteria bacterium]